VTLSPGDLRTRFEAVFPATSPAAVRVIFDDAVAHYAESHRHYHTIEHIAAMLAHIDHYDQEYQKGHPELELAIWFHDVIWRPPPISLYTNEEDSGEYAKNLLTLARHPDLGLHVAVLIKATTHTQQVGTPTAQALLDADLAFLGSPPDVYALYSSNVRKEYACYDDASWKSGRTHVLDRLLDRPFLYYNRAVRDDLEKQARTNIAAEIASL
jgi:predicted metal-dependent HD superfamily phosphohydrolase